MRQVGLLSLVVLCAVTLAPSPSAQNRPAAAPAARPPIIDMHLHAVSMRAFGGNVINCGAGRQEFAPRDGRAVFHVNDVRSLCDVPIVSPATDEEHQDQTLKYLEEYNITAVLIAGPKAAQVWKQKAKNPDRLLLAMGAGPWFGTPFAEYQKLFASGGYAVMAESLPQAFGFPPDHVSMEPYWQMAVDRDIPVGIHMGLAAPAADYVGEPGYLVSQGNPLLLEPVLRRHPRLRVYVHHAGWPLMDEMIALMYSHPQVYVDVGIINFGIPVKEFHTYLKRLVEAGFGNRIMFGSDQFMWPQAIPISIESVQSADFLTEAQKRDIFYNNAARFLRLKTPPASASR